MRAALLRQATKPLVVEDVAVAPLDPNWVRVQMDAAGVCHSDLSAMTIDPCPLPLPLIMGHEGAGTVLEVGSNVTLVRPGDRVVAALFPVCGQCFHCVRGESNLCDRTRAFRSAPMAGALDGSPIHAMGGVGAFAELMTLPQEMIVRVDTDLPAEQLSLLGCGFTTGVGAAIWTAKVPPGASVAVFGCGGVGQAVIQGARLTGAAHIYAVDPVAMKRSTAERLGATRLIDPAGGDPVEQILEATGGRGTDFSFEAIGRADTTAQAIAAVRKGGTMVAIGGASAVSIALPSVLEGKTIKFSLYGSAQVRHHIPVLVDLVEAGRLDLASMISKTVALDQVNDAFTAMESGEAIRTVVVA